MLDGIKRRIDHTWFDMRCSGIYETAAVGCDSESDVVVVSQLYSPDLTMYMLAAKSFARYIRPLEFVIVDDGLTATDRVILGEHFDRVRFVNSRDVDTGRCPKGSCWERFLTLSRENESHYVVQLDSDTLTLADPVHVKRCLQAQRTFTLGTTTGREVVPSAVATAYAQAQVSSHVQNLAERALLNVPNGSTLKYVRGCAGFTGFAKGQLERSRIETYSEAFEDALGSERWRSWGTEQFTCNLMAANAPNPLVLPVEQYPFWAPGMTIEQARLVHFFGTFRFSRGMYATVATRLIHELKRLQRSHTR